MTTYCNPPPFNNDWREHYQFIDYWNLAMFGALKKTFPVPNLQAELRKTPNIFRLLPDNQELAQRLGIKWYRGTICENCTSLIKWAWEPQDKPPCILCGSKTTKTPDLGKHREVMRAVLPAPSSMS